MKATTYLLAGITLLKCKGWGTVYADKHKLGKTRKGDR